MNVLLVKLSSLGDVVHALAAWADVRAALPQARVGWVVEPAFAPLLRLAGVAPVIEAPLRRWRGHWFAAPSRADRAALRRALQADAWDVVVDLQGLVKSAWVMRQARLAPGGVTAGLGLRTDGSGWEWPVRWMQQRSLLVPKRIHAVARSRLLVAQTLGLPSSLSGLGAAPGALPAGPVLRVSAQAELPVGLDAAALARSVVLVHGTSRADKLWPEASWVTLAQRLVGEGWQVALPAAGPSECARATRLAAAIGRGAVVWPEMPLDELTVAMAGCAGCVGVDSGVSHIAVALDLPHVQVYNVPTAWRTGPVAGVFGTARQLAVEPLHERDAPVRAQALVPVPPEVSAVWAAWQRVAPNPPVSEAWA